MNRPLDICWRFDAGRVLSNTSKLNPDLVRRPQRRGNSSNQSRCSRHEVQAKKNRDCDVKSLLVFVPGCAALDIVHALYCRLGTLVSSPPAQFAKVDRRRNRWVCISDAGRDLTGCWEAAPDTPGWKHCLVPAVNTFSAGHDLIPWFRCAKSARVWCHGFPPKNPNKLGLP